MARHISRRDFVSACAALPVIQVLDLARTQERPWRISMVGPREPGTRIALHGVIVQPDGVTPVSGVKMFLYQTDAAGWYTRPVNNPRESRLHGTLWTDAKGRYEFLTVDPAYYADVSPPPARHIHVHLEPPGLPDHWVDSFKFADDRYITTDDVQKNAPLELYSAIVRLHSENDGLHRARRDFRISPDLAERNRLVNGWYRS